MGRRRERLYFCFRPNVEREGDGDVEICFSLQRTENRAHGRTIIGAPATAQGNPGE